MMVSYDPIYKESTQSTKSFHIMTIHHVLDCILYYYEQHGVVVMSKYDEKSDEKKKENLFLHDHHHFCIVDHIAHDDDHDDDVVLGLDISNVNHLPFTPFHVIKVYTHLRRGIQDQTILYTSNPPLPFVEKVRTAPSPKQWVVSSPSTQTRPHHITLGDTTPPSTSNNNNTKSNNAHSNITITTSTNNNTHRHHHYQNSNTDPNTTFLLHSFSTTTPINITNHLLAEPERRDDGSYGLVLFTMLQSSDEVHFPVEHALSSLDPMHADHRLQPMTRTASAVYTYMTDLQQYKDLGVSLLWHNASLEQFIHSPDFPRSAVEKSKDV